MSTPTPEPEAWRRVDAFLSDTLVHHDERLEREIEDQERAGLPPIEVSPVTGKLLHLLARIARAERVLEIGTLAGYSTTWLARALPADGSVTTIEIEPRNAEIARRNVDRAGVGDRVDIRIGRAADVLPTLTGPFDLVFIDADKPSNAVYLDWAARLGRPGAVVVVDNVVRAGEITDREASDDRSVGARETLRMLGTDPRFDATALQTLDRKGWDGVAIAVLTDVASDSADLIDP